MPKTWRPWSATLALALGVAPVTALGQAPTLKTIVVDGNLSDWDEVLLNPLQVTLDGDGSSIPCAYSTDRDCAVQGTGRDLREFAWTYDATHVYYHVRRQGSVSNEQTFWFYMDVDVDGRMGFGDVVLRVKYAGSTGATQNDVFRYVPSLPAGDPLVDGAGLADGYTLPGNLNAAATWTEGVPNGGAASGLVFEERVPWSAVGVPPGTGISFHVASSNSGNPGNISSQVDDNLGGLDGGVGSLGFDLVVVAPDGEGTVVPGGTITYAHEVTNSGSRPAAFDLRVGSTLGLEVEIRSDPDADGVGDALLATDANGDGDFGDAGDFLDPAADVNQNGWPETGELAPGATAPLVLVLRTLQAQDGLRDVTTLTAWLPSTGVTVEADASDTTAIGMVTLTSPDSAKNGVAGQNVSYGLLACNNGPPDTFDLSGRSTESLQLSLYSDPECDGVPNDFLAQDRRGTGSWDVTVAGDSDGDGDPDTGPLGTGACTCFVLQVSLPGNAVLGRVDTTTVTALGSAQPSTGAQGLVTTVSPRLQVFPSYTFATQTEKVAGAARSVYFAHVARNNWVVADTVDFTVVPPTNSQGWTVRTWSDPDGDGRVLDGQVITATPLIAPNGGERHFVVEVQVPAGVPNGTRATTVVTAASGLDPAIRQVVTDELEVSAIATYSDPFFRVPETFFVPCARVHVQGTGLQRPGGQFEDLYDLAYFDGSGANVRFFDLFVPDGSGTANDSYVSGAGDVAGAWRIELRERTFPIAEAQVTVEANGILDPLRSTQPLYPLVGSSLGVVSTLTNGNRLSTVTGSTIEYVVLDPAGTRYLAGGAASTFQPYTGAETTRLQAVPTLLPGNSFNDPHTIPNVTYPVEGSYRIVASWRASCGAVIGTRTATYLVGSGEFNCTNRSDDDGDGLIDCADPECFTSPACRESPCTDDLDSDGDTLVDCADPDCDSHPRCRPERQCDDGEDDDGDTLIDCADSDCVTDPDCPETDCTNGLDDDGDTSADCADADCDTEPSCIEAPCDDGIDNDGDGRTDCADLDCALDPPCRPEPDCANRLDDDGDTLIDCADPDCAAVPGCVELDCANGDDDDLDGRTDCADSDCAADPACLETNCADRLDDDADTLVDCDDDDCAADPACQPEVVCTDGLDDDLDGFVDCFDTDCALDPACQGADTDGDTVPDPQDCAPGDPDAWRAPGEIPRLDVRKLTGGAAPDAEISWTAVDPAPGTRTEHDVVTGLVVALRDDRSFSGASCLEANVTGLTAADPRPLPGVGDGFWYLVQAQNACRAGGYGVDGDLAPRAIDPQLCP